MCEYRTGAGRWGAGPCLGNEGGSGGHAEQSFIAHRPEDKDTTLSLTHLSEPAVFGEGKGYFLLKGEECAQNTKQSGEGKKTHRRLFKRSSANHFQCRPQEFSSGFHSQCHAKYVEETITTLSLSLGCQNALARQVFQGDRT